jgi:putative FmdB family regulatory protein
MPLYDYQCAKCGAVFEVRQKFSDAPLTEHEGCGGELTKLLSAPAFQFKGSGWYITDYARGGSSPKSESSSKSDTSSSDGVKTESSKPAESKPATPAPTSSTTKSE